MLSFRAAALSDIGRVRRDNEDRFVCDQQLLVFGVADGVGGLPGGGEAAENAIQEVMAGFRAANHGAPDLSHLVQHANSAVSRLGQSISPGLGIGTTLTFGCIRNGAMHIAHVGDSRCYVSRRREFARVTEDHSVENEARMRRARGEVIFYHEANRNALTRCIGQPMRVEVDLHVRALAAGDRYLFCTDGVTRMVTDSDLASLVAGQHTPESAAKEIVAAAVTRGGPDNATVVLVFIDEV